jgi:hypothetical protein
MNKGVLAALATLTLAATAACGDAPAPVDRETTAHADEAWTLGCPLRPAHAPIVLVHGFAGFRGALPLEYYVGVAEQLRAFPYCESVEVAQLPAFATSIDRAAVLAPFLDAVHTKYGRKANVIAHSQGGIDTRYALQALGRGGDVASVITIATPNEGAANSAFVLGTLGSVPAPVLAAAQLAIGAIYGALFGDFNRTDVKAAFGSGSYAFVLGADGRGNPDLAPVAGIPYFTVAGRSGGQPAGPECDGLLTGVPGTTFHLTTRDTVSPLLAPIESYVRGQAGTNDGLIEVSTAKWGSGPAGQVQFLGCVPADHLDQVGLPFKVFPDAESGFSHFAMFGDLVRFLHQSGY